MVSYSFVPENRELIEEQASCIQAIKFVEDLCKNNGFSITTCHICKGYIVRHVIANANPRKAMLGVDDTLVSQTLEQIYY